MDQFQTLFRPGGDFNGDTWGDFNGYAWGENIGWVSFNSTGAVSYKVKTAWLYENCVGDVDCDNVPDSTDNCPLLDNQDQADSDGDGAGDVCDCDNTDETVYPLAPELCDGLDNDCDGLADEGLTPEAPGDLSAAAVFNSGGQINLAWVDNSNCENGFQIERKDDINQTLTLINTTAVNVTDYQDTALAPDTIYYYRIRAVNDTSPIDVNYSDYTSEVNATTFANNPPDTPVNSSPDDGTSGVSHNPTLCASAFSDPDNHTHRASLWQITTVPGDYSSPVYEVIDTDTPDLTCHAVNQLLDAETTHYWQVSYQDQWGHWSDFSAETSFTTIAQVIPAGVVSYWNFDEGSGIMPMILLLIIIMECFKIVLAGLTSVGQTLRLSLMGLMIMSLFRTAPV